MGRLNGFLGGAVLSASVIYLSTLRMQSDYYLNSLKLREYRKIIESLHYPPEETGPVEQRILRPSFVETFKDTWNSEVERITGRIQDTDWVRIRERVEDAAENLWEKAWKKVEEAKRSS